MYVETSFADLVFQVFSTCGKNEAVVKVPPMRPRMVMESIDPSDAVILRFYSNYGETKKLLQNVFYEKPFAINMLLGKEFRLTLFINSDLSDLKLLLFHF